MNCLPMKTIIITLEQATQRLDKAAGLLPGLGLQGLGLRGRRRLIEQGSLLVNNKPSLPAYKLRPGDILSVSSESGQPCQPGQNPDLTGTTETALPWEAPACLITRFGDMAVIYKPAHLHSVALRGGAGLALENMLPDLLGVTSAPERSANLPGTSFASQPADNAPIFFQMLNRLDWATSGLTPVATSQAAATLWRHYQANGQISKHYLAILQGRLEKSFCATGQIDSSRTPVLVHSPPEPDELRHTCFLPLAVFTGQTTSHELTLCACSIKCGKRHQIRAHAAMAGVPLLGDVRYGANQLPVQLPGQLTDKFANGLTNSWTGAYKTELFFLHHAAFTLPGFSADCAPPWLKLLPPEAALAAKAWHKSMAQ